MIADMTNQTDDSNQQAAFQVQTQFWKALQDKNQPALEKLLADDFIARSPNQIDQTRPTFIDTLISFPGKVLTIGSDNLEVHLFGDMAVVTGVQVAQIQLINGQIVSDTIAITNILQKQDSQWQMRLSHAVELR